MSRTEPFYPNALDNAEYNVMTEAERIGYRIRKIREEKGISRIQFGEKIGLNTNRIQQYENGARKPKMELLKLMAAALEVETTALLDPVPLSRYGDMYALFELEDIHGLKLIPNYDSGKYNIEFSKKLSPNINYFLAEWQKVMEKRDLALSTAQSLEEKKQIWLDYHMWQWTFPMGLTAPEDQQKKKEMLIETVKKLQEQIKIIEESEDN